MGLDDFDKKKFWTHFSKEVFVPEDIFYEKCFDENLSLPIVVHEGIWATQLVTWDKLGGMDLKLQEFFLAYQFRALLLGYKVITK